MKWMYNLDSNNDMWTSDKYETREEAIQAALEEWTERMLEDRASVEKEFQLGQFVQHVPQIDADWILDELYERAASECGEASESWLSGIPKEAGEKLQEQINKVTTEWLKELKEYPTFGLIEKVEIIDASKLEYKEN
ncbi:TPA: hypothetical protein QC443_005912 [Bacillus cereus]|uniref:hypothetical protein n=1 Tax=Bacillus TaxID=1386 RepID=UPI00114FFF3F|nr:hypothetical protein [Bacillus cereus]MBL3768660.1 hypothetical protein [Bacillus cereus]MBL3881106.1 hypothetical protein [Bacillus cereus]MBL3881187.1 hypothetical protein [Bacillus cereus]HDR8058219.1 hypothetical protein [Bacillus cereus]HDR8206653.1 hypothetical protein [Bacillus cereus]